MSDPSTLLLLTCAACIDATPSLQNQDDSICVQTQGQTQENQQVAGSLDCISPPETIPVSLGSSTSAVEILQAKSLNDNQSVSRRNSPELFASLPTVASQLGAKQIARTPGKIPPKSYQQAAISPLVSFIPPTLRLFSPGPEYLWFLGWVTIYGGGLVVILKDDINNYIKGFRAFKNSGSGKKDDAFAGDYSVEYRRLSEVITTTDQAQSQEVNRADASSKAVESEKIDLPAELVTQLPDKSEHGSRVFLKNLRTLIQVVAQNDTDQTNPDYSAANGSKFGYFLPLNNSTQPQKNTQNSLFHFPNHQNNTSKLRALFADRNGKLYIGDREISTLSDDPSSNVSSTKSGRQNIDEEEVFDITLETVDHQLRALWAEQISVEPHKQLFPTLTNPPNLVDYEEQEVKADTETNDDHDSCSENSLAKAKTDQQETRANTETDGDHNSSSEKTSVKAETEVNDDSNTGALIATLSSGNPKANETYTYSLIDDAGGRFILKGNELRVINSSVLDSEENNVYTVTVRRQNSKGLSIDKSFRIKSSLTAR